MEFLSTRSATWWCLKHRIFLFLCFTSQRIIWPSCHYFTHLSAQSYCLFVKCWMLKNHVLICSDAVIIESHVVVDKVMVGSDVSGCDFFMLDEIDFTSADLGEIFLVEDEYFGDMNWANVVHRICTATLNKHCGNCASSSFCAPDLGAAGTCYSLCKKYFNVNWPHIADHTLPGQITACQRKKVTACLVIWQPQYITPVLKPFVLFKDIAADLYDQICGVWKCENMYVISNQCVVVSLDFPNCGLSQEDLYDQCITECHMSVWMWCTRSYHDGQTRRRHNQWGKLKMVDSVHGFNQTRIDKDLRSKSSCKSSHYLSAFYYCKEIIPFMREMCSALCNFVWTTLGRPKNSFQWYWLAWIIMQIHGWHQQRYKISLQTWMHPHVACLGNQIERSTLLIEKSNPIQFLIQSLIHPQWDKMLS